MEISMDHRTLLSLVAATALYAVPAAAVTVSNTAGKQIQISVENNGSPIKTKVIAAGKSVTFDCKSGCGVGGPWQGVEWAKGDETLKTDGKTISSNAM
jgi:hypothetical protein